MGNFFYFSKLDDGSRGGFYIILKNFTDKFLKSSQSHASMYIAKELRQFITTHQIEKPRSLNEYHIEYLMFGIFWRKYSGYSANINRVLHSLCNALYQIRNQSKTLKPFIDKIRGKVAVSRLYKKNKTYELIPIYENIIRLINWLDASKNFTEEVKRLNNWLVFLEKKSPIYIARFISNAIELEKLFVSMASPVLGNYLQSVNLSVNKHKRKYKNREAANNYKRAEVEYFFYMMATEIFNRELKGEFDKTTRKVVLLPTSLCRPKSVECKLNSDGIEISCTGCSEDCQINDISRSIEGSGAEVQLISGSLDFSKWLSALETNPNIGLVNVACVLDMFPKVYGMRSLNIPSQHILLDQCGCHKHLPSANCPTIIDQQQLLKVLGLKHHGHYISLSGISKSTNHFIPTVKQLNNKNILKVKPGTFAPHPKKPHKEIA